MLEQSQVILLMLGKKNFPSSLEAAPPTSKIFDEAMVDTFK
jgi:hypothetical protein